MRLYFPKPALRFGVAALVALAIQVLVLSSPFDMGEATLRVVFPLSYVLLLGFVAANIKRPGLAILGLGVLLNFLAIVSNGGLMPVSPGALERAELDIARDVSVGEWVPGTKDVLLTGEKTHLRFLTDILVWRNPSSVRAFSVGDLIIGLGLVVTLGELFLPRVQRASSDEPSPT